MKDFKDYINEAGSWFDNPMDDIQKYIVGTTNRLRLVQPEEVQHLQPQLRALKETLDRILGES